MTLKLCGFAASNYYNKLKLQLLEKQVAFTEELIWTGTSLPQLLDRSPLGKVPFLDTPQGPVSESMACAEYIEATYPATPLLPADPYAAAKVREIIVHCELHLELVARQLYPQAYFGGTVTDEVKERCLKLLRKGAQAFAKLAKFSPYVAGAELTLADCAAVVHLPIISGASKLIYGEDVLAGLPLGDYMKMMGARPHVQRVNAERKLNTAEMMAKRGQKAT